MRVKFNLPLEVTGKSLDEMNDLKSKFLKREKVFGYNTLLDYLYEREINFYIHSANIDFSYGIFIDLSIDIRINDEEFTMFYLKFSEMLDKLKAKFQDNSGWVDTKKLKEELNDNL